mgnify:CR=1 FL=1
MQTLYFGLALFLLLSLVAGMWRVLRGPTAADRMLAAYEIGGCSVIAGAGYRQGCLA